VERQTASKKVTKKSKKLLKSLSFLTMHKHVSDILCHYQSNQLALAWDSYTIFIFLWHSCGTPNSSKKSY